MKDGSRHGLLLLLIVLAALALRLVLLATCLGGIDGDQAMMGLMGRHILKGKLFIFFWENKYCGAFISYLAALNFKLFGASILSFKLATFPLVAISVVYGAKLAEAIYGRAAGLLTGLFLALPPMFVMIFSVSPRGIYAEALAFGPVMLYLTYTIAGGGGEAWLKKQISLLGFVSGFACWLSPLVTPFFLASCFMLWFHGGPAVKKRFFSFAVFFIIGAAPLLTYNIQHPFATFLSLGSRPLDLTRADLRADLASSGLLVTLLKYLLCYLRGLPASFLHVLANTTYVFRWANPLTEKITAFYIILNAVYLAPVIYFAFKRGKAGRDNIPAYLFFFSLLFALFGSLDSPRYLLPVWPAAAIFLAAALVRLYGYSRPLAGSLLAVVVGINLWGGLLCLSAKPIPYGQLSDHLISKNLLRGYAGYWTAYPVTFVSGEQVIVSPTLYVGSILAQSKDTYPFYTNLVDGEKEVFYVTNDSAESAALFDAKMRALQVRYKKDQVPPFMVYYSFSKRLYPMDLDLPQAVTAVSDPFFY